MIQLLQVFAVPFVIGIGQLLAAQGSECHDSECTSAEVAQGEGHAMLQTKKMKALSVSASRVPWNLSDDGSFKAVEPLAAEARFPPKPDNNVGCESCDCSFVTSDEYAAPCDIEINSRIAIAKWLPENATVLEVGARHGSTSCAIAHKLKQSGKAVSMDADETVWEALTANINSHGCSVNTAHGLLGKEDGLIVQNHYGTMAAPKDAMASHVADGGVNASVVVPHFTIEKLQQDFNLHFDAAVFDCEGCFTFVMRDFPEFASQLSTLIVEAHDADEQAAVAKLLEQGWKLDAAFGRQKILLRK